MDFHQRPPTLSNTFRSDESLKRVLRKYLAPDSLSAIEKHLDHVGQLASTRWLEWSREAEANEPELIAFDPWGCRIDRIRTSSGWKNLEAAAATEGIVASGYERKYGDRSRIYQAALLYLFHPSSAFVSCPLAMTDGAARAIELYGDDQLKKGAFIHLTSREPSKFWTSGQWMTEKTGGSDVSGTSTIATRRENANDGFDWELDGLKWFTSATTSQMAMLLARPAGAEAGSRGLSLFYTELRDSEDRLKNIEILRLKEKLGTRALPTAELRLKGTPARLVGGEGSGVRKIASLFNITRVYNSICATAHLRRALDLARSYSHVREAFGKKLSDHPLHVATLATIEDEYAKCLDLTFYVAHLLGKEDCGTASEDETILLRALTPIVKLFTAKRCVEGVSEVVESFGGAGYVEDTGIPILLRDAQVFSIWEGTTNVLSLDFLRALEKENAGPVLMRKIESDFKPAIQGPAKESWQTIQTSMKKAADGDREGLERDARKLAFAVAEVVALGLRG